MNAYLSDKIRVISLITMVLLTLVHAYTYPSNIFTGAAWSMDGLVFSIQYYLSQGLAKFRVPMFFILSGYFFFSAMFKAEGAFLTQFSKRLRTIALPYLLWSVCGLVFYAVMQWPAATRVFFQHNFVWELTPLQVVEKVLLDPIPYQLWFLRDLMVLYALSPLIHRTIRLLGIVALVPMLITWLLDTDLVILGNESLPFYMAGAWLAMHGPSKEPALTDRERRVIVVGWLLLLAVKTALVVFNTADATLIRQLHHLTVFWGLVAVWVGYDLIVQGRDVKRSRIHPFTRYAFFLYVSHEPLLTVAKRLLFLLPGQGPVKDLLVYFTAPLITIPVCFATAALLLNHAPRAYGLLTGGRGAPRKSAVQVQAPMAA